MREVIKKLASTKFRFPWEKAWFISGLSIVVVGSFVGTVTFLFPDYVEAQQMNFLYFTAFVGFAIEVFLGLSLCVLNKNKPLGQIFWPLVKEILVAVIFVSFFLFSEALMFSGLCGAHCSEFSGLSVLLVFFWVPRMAVGSLLLALLLRKFFKK